MRTLAVIPVVVIAICALSGIGHAADLQAGWYANIEHVDIWIYQGGVPVPVDNAYFYQTSPGPHDPFLVTGGSPSRDYRRYVSVPIATPNAQPEQSLVMPLYIGLPQGTRLAYLAATWQTYYSPGQMNLQLWHTTQAGVSTMLWTQSLEGHQGDGISFAYDTALDGYYSFRVAIVPEPSAALVLVLGAASVFCWRRRQ
jgi:hypothetical protein